MWDHGLKATRSACRAAMMILALLAASLAPSGSHLARGQTPRYTMALVGVPLPEALVKLIDETQLGLVYESKLVSGRTTFCRAENLPAERLLACVLRDTGLDYVRLSSGTYVLVADPRAPPRYGRLTGQVVDAATALPLADANVMLADEGLGTASNGDGRFAFAGVKAGMHRLVVTHVAYHDAVDTVWVAAGGDDATVVRATPRVLLAAPVIVRGFSIRLPSEGLGAGSRTAQDLAKRGATADVVRDLGAVAGVRFGDALADVHIQGGADDEQQFLLDGVPVFLPVSTGGLIGPFSPFAVRQVTVRKAGFGAAHGSHLAGVVEVDQALAADGDAHLALQIDPLSLNARWNGQSGHAVRRQLTWMVAARHGLWNSYHPARLERLFRRWGTADELLTAERAATAGDPTGPVLVRFDDVHAAARLRLGGLRSLHLAFYQGADAFGLDDVAPATTGDAVDTEDAYHWGNRALRLAYEWVQSRRLFVNAAFWSSDYHLSHRLVSPPSESAATAQEFNELHVGSARVGAEYAASGRHHVRGAIEVTDTDSDVQLALDPARTIEAFAGQIRPIRWRVAGFIEDRWSAGGGTAVTAGTRLTLLPAQATAYAEPRLSVQHDHRMRRGGTWAFRGAAGLYRQYLHAFDAATYGIAAMVPRLRLWLPVGKAQRPPAAVHLSAGFLYRPDALWEVGIETYYKRQPHLWVLDYGRLAGPPPARDDPFIGADGFAYGATFSVHHTGGRVQLGAQYDYAVARRRIRNRFGGAYVPVPWDAPHRLTAGVDVALGAHLSATARWEALLGRRWGFHQAYYDLLEPDPAKRRYDPFDLSDPAAHRLPPFSQMDVGLAYSPSVGGKSVQLRLTAINAFDRHNVTEWSLYLDEATGRYRRADRTSIPFLLMASLRVGL